MSHNDTNDLIDEQELRDALRPLRPDREAFEARVRRQIEAGRLEAAKRLPAENQQQQASDQSQWLQVAASVIPFSLLGKVAGGGTPIPLGKLSFGYKLIGYAALPATSLLLMVGATIFGLVRIGRAQRSPQAGGDQTQQQTVTILRWWKQFGLVVGCSMVLGAALIFFGYVLPVSLVFLASGITMVSLVTCLGRAGMIDRQAVGGCLMPGLMLLAQLTPIYSMFGGMHLLDQSLISAVMFGAVAVLFIIMVCTDSKRRQNDMHGPVFMCLLSICLVGFSSNTIWAPVTEKTLKKYVESFAAAPFHSASWNHWAVPASWLRDTGVVLDLSKPRGLLQREITGDQNPYILAVAFDTGSLESADLSRLRDLAAAKSRLLSDGDRTSEIPSISYHNYEVQALVATGQLTEADRDFLAARLLATLHAIEASKYSQLADALVTIKLLDVLDRPCDVDSVRDSLHRTLVDLQRVRIRFGSPSGGFSIVRDLDHSDPLATAAAVELMELVGIPAKVDVNALRSYLRPSQNDRLMMMQSVVRVATRQRLESISGLRPITWWDYVRYEQNLWMSLLVVLLCFYATLGSPIRGMSATASDERGS